MSPLEIGALLWLVGLPLAFFLLLAVYPPHLRRRVQRYRPRRHSATLELSARKASAPVSSSVRNIF